MVPTGKKIQCCCGGETNGGKRYIFYLVDGEESVRLQWLGSGDSSSDCSSSTDTGLSFLPLSMASPPKSPARGRRRNLWSTPHGKKQPVRSPHSRAFLAVLLPPHAHSRLLPSAAAVTPPALSVTLSFRRFVRRLIPRAGSGRRRRWASDSSARRPRAPAAPGAGPRAALRRSSRWPPLVGCGRKACCKWWEAGSRQQQDATRQR